MRRVVVVVLVMLTVLGNVLGGTGLLASAANSAASTLLLGLDGVSCVSASFCAAVGSQGDSAHLSKGDLPLAMVWNGTRWRKTPASLPKGSSEGQLLSVSCTSAAWCVAVGAAFKGFNGSPFAAKWNGRTWAATALPRPRGTLAGVRDSISCGAPRRCVAAFLYSPMPTGGKVYAATLTGATWTAHALPPPKRTTFAAFDAVSCASATRCVLAGSFTRGPVGRGPVGGQLFESWNGRTFTTMNGPGTADVAYAAAWNGSTWKTGKLPPPYGIDVTGPRAVSCASSTRCLAVGDLARISGGRTALRAMAESYNGGSWTQVRVPVPAGDSNASFNAVSCLSATRCLAVGEAGPGSSLFSNAAFTGFWNGGKWRLVPAS